MSRSQASIRVFTFSAVSTAAILMAVLWGMGVSALLTTLVLVVIEITFSFENAIINAKILSNMSRFWQNMFLSIGIIIAIFGMRIVFPLAIVALSTHLPWRSVLDLALHNPDEYALKLGEAHVSIAAFGGAFLLMLAGSFFFDPNRTVLWLKPFERRLQRVSTRWVPAMLTAGAIGVVAYLGQHATQTVTAGAFGIVTFAAIHGLAELFGRLQPLSSRSTAKKVGFSAFISFLYLELLDASFSLDGVIGAFAITDKVILIAAGLGAGALWVRSMTVYIVRKQTLKRYRFVEHGAHYTVLILALVMLLSVVFDVPEALVGIAGIIIIASSIIASGNKGVTRV